jgi:hypothetical protein
MVIEDSFGKTTSVIIARADEEQVVDWNFSCNSGSSLDGRLI